MALKVSTGLRNYLLDTGSLKDALALGFIKYYEGPVPASADDAITGSHTLICTLSDDATGTGISFDAAAANGVLSKDITQIWRGVNVASGTPTFYRHVAVEDTGALSATQPRLQGGIAVVGAEINLSNSSLTNGASETLDFYVVNFPTL